MVTRMNTIYVKVLLLQIKNNLNAGFIGFSGDQFNFKLKLFVRSASLCDLPFSHTDFW